MVQTFSAAEDVVDVLVAAEELLGLAGDGVPISEPDRLLLWKLVGDGVHDAAHHVLRCVLGVLWHSSTP